jgi:two-component system sensor histidine kinase/response regulator
MRRSRSILNFALLAIVTLAIALNVYVHVFLRADAEREEVAVMERLARIHGQDIESTLDNVRYSLDKAALLYRLLGHDGPAYHAELKKLEAELPHVRAVGVVDATGMVVHSSRSHPPPAISLADRDYIAYYLKGGTRSSQIGSPVRNIFDGQWQLGMAVPLRDGAGVLLGVVTAVIDPVQIGVEFAGATAEGDIVTLLDRNFHMIARHPWREEAIGQAFDKVPAYIAMSSDAYKQFNSGLFKNTFTGEPRFAAVRRIYDGALVLSTSRSEPVALRNWRQLALLISGASAAIVLLAGLASWQALRRLESEARKNASLGSLNRQLQEQTARAEKLAAAKSEFLATMSHEIRTPMNGVLGMAQALQAMPLAPQAREAAEVITESASSLLGVLNDVLDFSRLESGKLAITAAPLSLPALLHNVEALFASAAQAKGLSLRLEVAGDVPAGLVSDEARLRQILINLVGNAVKFTQAGFVQLLVRRDSGPAGVPILRFEVSDSGPGIAEEAQATIFDRFTQEDASISRQFGGTGLGLAITRRLVELLGGRIGCKSQKGAGATFWVELPLQEAEAISLTSPMALAQAVAPLAPGPSRLLCVDDNLVNRRTLQALLLPFGYDLTLVESGEEAVAVARGQAFDSVLLDIHMPGMDGFETLRALRKLPGTARARILAMTADVMPEAVLRYESAGFQGVVAKPLIVKDLIGALAAE